MGEIPAHFVEFLIVPTAVIKPAPTSLSSITSWTLFLLDLFAIISQYFDFSLPLLKIKSKSPYGS